MEQDIFGWQPALILHIGEKRLLVLFCPAPGNLAKVRKVFFSRVVRLLAKSIGFKQTKHRIAIRAEQAPNSARPVAVIDMQLRMNRKQGTRRIRRVMSSGPLLSSCYNLILAYSTDETLPFLPRIHRIKHHPLPFLYPLLNLRIGRVHIVNAAPFTEQAISTCFHRLRLLEQRFTAKVRRARVKVKVKLFIQLPVNATRGIPPIGKRTKVNL